jgi:hypothetical protein
MRGIAVGADLAADPAWISMRPARCSGASLVAEGGEPPERRIELMGRVGDVWVGKAGGNALPQEDPRDRGKAPGHRNRENPRPHDLRRDTPRTAESRLAAPTPTIAPVIVWVVLTGTPSAEARKIAPAPPVSAQNPPNGLSLVMRVPIVFTMRHPPSAVPSAMAL